MDTNIKATQVLELLNEKKVNFLQDRSFSLEYFSRHSAYINQFVKRSQKFLAGELEEIPIVDIEEEVLRLPFPETYVEGTWRMTEGAKLDRVAFLCTEHESSSYKPEPGEEYRFAVRTLILNNNLPTGTVLVDPLYVTIFGVSGPEKAPFMKSYKLTNQQDDPNHQKKVKEEEEFVRKSLFALQYRLLHFLALISCSNVGVKDIEAPVRLNKARESSGKLPFFKYKTLFIRSSKTEYTTSVSKEESLRASPCLHWRRGHIRKLHAGAKRIWVGPSLVGDPKRGSMDKTYSR